ncbi:HAD-IA family hydrolase [Streptomyces sp. DSM 44915]|uniref:HAD-IA family hydrolase n=1 Tax=Streptomyces chisholmiae TaxID=3075540 RepID=A0ABU2JPL4_9ACTN|nr:HAD-IA family hydrolase [Streptomyces sp. DSM 44915]MDT0266937.1 HAD-IA family hydrolase [Streptomyces sp. DSM 44915]
MAGRRYEALVLDFGGVLTAGLEESIASWCTAEGLAAGAWGAALGEHPEGRALYQRLELGQCSQHEWNAAMGPLLGVAGDDLMGRAWAGVRPAARMVALARRARAAGYAVAMLSNSFGLDPYDPYGRLGVWELFDVSVLSEREGLAKPESEIYRRVLARLGLPGSACVFVDDQARNLPPAEALGMTTVLATDEHGTAARVAALLADLDPEPADGAPADGRVANNGAVDSGAANSGAANRGPTGPGRAAGGAAESGPVGGPEV